MVSKAAWLCIGAAAQRAREHHKPSVFPGSYTLWLYNLSVGFQQAEEGAQNGREWEANVDSVEERTFHTKHDWFSHRWEPQS